MFNNNAGEMKPRNIIIGLIVFTCVLVGLVTIIGTVGTTTSDTAEYAEKLQNNDPATLADSLEQIVTDRAPDSFVTIKFTARVRSVVSDQYTVTVSLVFV